MQKLTNLFRLDAANRRVVAKYLLKRILGRETTLAEKLANEFYFHLIRSNGVLKEETAEYYISFYRDLNITICVRKRPSSDIDVFRQIFLLREYQPLVDTYRANFESGNVNIIDAGANIGLTSVYLAKAFGNSRVICVEPDEHNFERLSYNLETNQLGNTVKIKGGIWSKDANLKIVNDFRDKKDWSFRVEETDEKGLPAFSVSSLMRQHEMPVIDILKIDIEGSEKEIFSPWADQSFLEKTKCIAIEIHDEFDCRKRIYDVLSNYGFEYFDAEDLTIGVNRNLK